jgi:hypothetical protein
MKETVGHKMQQPPETRRGSPGGAQKRSQEEQTETKKTK